MPHRKVMSDMCWLKVKSLLLLITRWSASPIVIRPLHDKHLLVEQVVSGGIKLILVWFSSMCYNFVARRNTNGSRKGCHVQIHTFWWQERISLEQHCREHMKWCFGNHFPRTASTAGRERQQAEVKFIRAKKKSPRSICGFCKQHQWRYSDRCLLFRVGVDYQNSQSEST